MFQTMGSIGQWLTGGLLPLLLVTSCLSGGCVSGGDGPDADAKHARFLAGVNALSDLSHKHGGSGHATISTDGTLGLHQMVELGASGGFQGSAHYQFNSQNAANAGDFPNMLAAMLQLGVIKPGGAVDATSQPQTPVQPPDATTPPDPAAGSTTANGATVSPD